MSRLRFLTALAAIVALATALAACGGSDSPSSVIDNATLDGIESADIDLSLDVKAPGKEGGNLDLEASGPFQSEGEGEIPQLDLTATAKGKIDDSRIDFDGGLVLLPANENAYVEYDGVTYKVDPTTYAFLKGTLKERQREAEGEGDSESAAACQEAFGEIEVGDFMEEASSEANADVGGTSTTKVSGELDVAGALEELVELTESPACAAQLSTVGDQLPSQAEIDEARDEVEEGVKSAKVDVYVGDDDIVRRIVARLKIEPEGGGDGPERMDVDFDLTLTGVNEEQQIAAPQGRTKPLSELFIELGVNPIELIGLLQGEEGTGLEELLEGLEKGGGGNKGLGELFEGLEGLEGLGGNAR